jgi:predicted TIM-barrel fold metal-dependent hydrolase
MPCDGSCLHNSCTGLRHPAAALASAASGQRGIANTNMRPSRRAVLGIVAAAGASAVLGARRSVAQGAGKDWIIDTHHHIYPPRYTNANLQRLLADTSVLGASAYTGWSPQLALEQMDKAGVRSAVVSMTSPGIWWGNDEDGRTWARVCNEFGAQMARDFPGRFGMFAAIPLPDSEGSLREIAYALDTLKLDGIGLLTSYAGKPLGDPSFAPVFDELNRRKVALFVHPTMSCCGMKIANVDAPTIDFPNDTTKTLMSLANSGTFARCPDIRFIFSHGGGTMPMIVQRLVGAMRNLSPEQRAKVAPNGLEAELKRQYYDIASVAMNPAGMAAVFKFIPLDRLLYGSDAPFGSTTTIAAHLAKFELATSEITAIQHENALRLFPRFAA